MGYMEISIGGSDDAFDLYHSVLDDITKRLKREVKKNNGPFNTDGCVNVALVVQTIPKSTYTDDNEDYQALLALTVERLEKLIAESQDPEDWDSKANQKMHLDAYRKLLRSVRSKLAE